MKESTRVLVALAHVKGEAEVVRMRVRRLGERLLGGRQLAGRRVGDRQQGPRVDVPARRSALGTGLQPRVVRLIEGVE